MIVFLLFKNMSDLLTCKTIWVSIESLQRMYVGSALVMIQIPVACLSDYKYYVSNCIYLHKRTYI